jgi:5-methylcytosine-specific restriction protein B
LRQVWYYQIIPLLLEYFYNDGEKVAEIIGSTFIDKSTCSVNSELTNEEFINSILKLYKNG